MRSDGVRFLVLFPLAVCLLCQLPICASAADPVEHPVIGMHSAYQADALGNPRVWSGYLGEASGSPTYPGVLRIIPGDRWENFVSAAPAGVAYLVNNITLVKTAPAQQRCTEVFPAHTVVQQGVPNVRLVWPLIYEAPGTTWKLMIVYGTSTAWDDDGEGPNPAGFTHAETWTWTLGADIAHLRQLLVLLHDTEFGKSGSPVIGDEAVYTTLLGLLAAAETAEASSDYEEARARLEEFRTAVQAACITLPPAYPLPTGPGSGIASTPENPACCKLQIEVDYILSQPPYTEGLSVIVGRGKDAKSPSLTKPSGPSTNVLPVTRACIPLSSALAGDSAGNPVEYRGLAGIAPGPVTLPGVLGISPGANWSNFIGAAQAAVPYSVKNVVLQKQTPQIVACGDVFPASLISQEGTPNIRLWWPLMYEPSGTTWTLTILYGTGTPYDDDGPGPNPASYLHTEVWQWSLDSSFSNLSAGIELFHSLPFGTSEVPLVSDEELYTTLHAGLDSAATALSSGDLDMAGGALAAVAWAIDGSGIGGYPLSPSPTGPGTGIAATDENPARCKLLSDIEYVQYSCGIYATSSLDVMVGNSPTVHEPITVSAAYEGDLQGTARVFAGYDPSQSGAAAYPGVLSIEPGVNWSNYVGAAAAGVAYTCSDSVGLRMTAPQTIQCGEVFPSHTISQLYGPNIRLRWPLFYSSAGTSWRLTLVYQTPEPWDDDGPGPNLPSYHHADVWEWVIEASAESMMNRLKLSRDAPAGLSDSPLMSDEALYPVLVGNLTSIQEALASEDYVTAGLLLSDFEMNIMDSCIATAPQIPYPTGPGTGTLNTEENPACCALLADAEYFGRSAGILATTATESRRSNARPQPDTEAATAPVSLDPTAGEAVAVRHPSVTLSPASVGSSGDVPASYLGYNGTAVGAVPFLGVLGLLPGDDWGNFIAASEMGIPYTLEDVTLTKKTPAFIQCSEVFQSRSLVLSGEQNIRLWWPLLYDAPGTTYDLVLEYHTETERQFPGETAPSRYHTEQWRWEVGTGCTALRDAGEVFHTLPFGLDDVPLICNEMLFPVLQARLDAIDSAIAEDDIATASWILSDFQMEVMDACIACSPASPAPTGPGTGIASTFENPVCCYLLTHTEKIILALNEPVYQTYPSLASAVRTAEDGGAIGLPGPLVVTRAGADWLYAQTVDRSNGIRACGMYTGGISPGARIGIRGIMNTSGPERVIELASWDILQESGSLPRPLGMVGRGVGGSGQGLLPGFAGVQGLWNGGLRVMVSGVAGPHGDGFFYLDDGSGCQDGTGNLGIRIMLSNGRIPPEPGCKVCVIGISSWFENDDLARPAVLAGPDDGDVKTLSEAD